jgi:hypothetical protein
VVVRVGVGGEEGLGAVGRGGHCGRSFEMFGLVDAN